MWYKNIAGRFFGLVTKHACDRRTDGLTDGQNYDSQDRASIARAVKTDLPLERVCKIPSSGFASSSLGTDLTNHWEERPAGAARCVTLPLN